MHDLSCWIGSLPQGLILHAKQRLKVHRSAMSCPQAVIVAAMYYTCVCTKAPGALENCIVRLLGVEVRHMQVHTDTQAHGPLAAVQNIHAGQQAPAAQCGPGTARQLCRGLPGLHCAGSLPLEAQSPLIASALCLVLVGTAYPICRQTDRLQPSLLLPLFAAIARRMITACSGPKLCLQVFWADS